VLPKEESCKKCNCRNHYQEPDKVVLESLACGLHVRTNDPALKMLENASPAYVREHHSLQKLIPAIMKSMQAL